MIEELPRSGNLGGNNGFTRDDKDELSLKCHHGRPATIAMTFALRDTPVIFVTTCYDVYGVRPPFPQRV